MASILQTISELETIEEGLPRHTRKGISEPIRVSALPPQFRESTMKGDIDDDIDRAIASFNRNRKDNRNLDHEIDQVIASYNRKQKENRTLRMTIVTLLVFSLSLVFAVFGASITAARLSQDISVSHENGFAYIRGSKSDVMKTSEAIEYRKGVSVGELSNERLGKLREVVFEEGDLRFVVKGHARDLVKDQVLLLVEGGSILFDREGIVDSTGYAKTLLDTTFAMMHAVYDEEENRGMRKLCTSGSWSGFSAGEDWGWSW